MKLNDLLISLDINIKDNSKVFVFFSNEKISIELQESIILKSNKFIETWDSHGKSINANCSILYNFILTIIVDSNIDLGGCSKDRLLHFFLKLGKDNDINFFDRTKVYYMSEEEIKNIDFNDLSSLPLDTKVINPYFDDFKDFKDNFLVELKESKYSFNL